jgi:thiaminase (transcriptional activator TenA)
MRGDLLALRVALAPCVIGYPEIARRLTSRPDANAATNPYRVWIAEYAGAPYQACRPDCGWNSVWRILR